MNFPLPSLLPAFAEIFVLIMACLVLLADLFLGRKIKWLAHALSLITLIGAGFLTCVLFLLSEGQTVATFSNMYIHDFLGTLLKLGIYAAVFGVLMYSRGYLASLGRNSGEFYLLVLFATLGMMVMVTANHLLTLYLGLELLSLSLYALVALDRDSARSTEAAMKYFVLGALASGILLYGMSMIYGSANSLEIRAVFEAIQARAANDTVLAFGLVFLVSGLAFKLGVVPFHMWIPDVYHGARAPITLLIASAPKFAALAMVLRLLPGGLLGLADQWQLMLMFLAVLSIGLGNLVAIAQKNIKRMLGYSAISHMGFMLLGLIFGTGERTGFNELVYAYSASVFYVIAYVLMSLAAFGMIIVLSRAGIEAENIEDFKGLNKRSPWFAAIMAVVMFSMAGMPFFIGFWAKLLVLQVVVNAGYIGLAVFAVVMSLIGAFYYLRIVKVMYFDAPTDTRPLVASFDAKLALSINGILIAALGLVPNDLIGLCMASILHSFSFLIS